MSTASPALARSRLNADVRKRTTRCLAVSWQGLSSPRAHSSSPCPWVDEQSWCRCNRAFWSCGAAFPSLTRTLCIRPLPPGERRCASRLRCISPLTGEVAPKGRVRVAAPMSKGMQNPTPCAAQLYAFITCPPGMHYGFGLAGKCVLRCRKIESRASRRDHRWGMDHEQPSAAAEVRYQLSAACGGSARRREYCADHRSPPGAFALGPRGQAAVDCGRVGFGRWRRYRNAMVLCSWRQCEPHRQAHRADA